MPVSASYKPQPAILELSDKFYDRVEPAKFPKAIQRYINLRAAETVGLGELTNDDWQKYFCAFQPLERNLETPLALRYHGHQFQSYNPQLGDGRGFLYAQLRDDRGRLLDLGTKGSGQTPWSRSGDGRLTLKGAMREALATEMLEALGVNTSKTFCFFETGENLQRNDEPSPTRSAVLTRLGHSHIRFGTFQRQAYLQDKDALNELVTYTIRHFYPHLAEQPENKRVSALLREVTIKTAKLCAQWMLAGFVHGVLNTDNMNINGESFDYGPYRFLPTYDPEFTAAYFDKNGLYAYGRQPESVIWNLEQLATCLLMIDEDREALIDALRAFVPAFNEAAGRLMRERLGLAPVSAESSVATEDDLLMAAFSFLAKSQVPFECFFFDWYGGAVSRGRAMKSERAKFYEGDAFETFSKVIERWPTGGEGEVALKADYFSRSSPSTLLIDEIEAIWKNVAERDDWSKFEAKILDIRQKGAALGRK